MLFTGTAQCVKQIRHVHEEYRMQHSVKHALDTRRTKPGWNIIIPTLEQDPYWRKIADGAPRPHVPPSGDGTAKTKVRLKGIVRKLILFLRIPKTEKPRGAGLESDCSIEKDLEEWEQEGIGLDWGDSDVDWEGFLDEI